jgi:auxin-responsive protein IAA
VKQLDVPNDTKMVAATANDKDVVAAPRSCTVTAEPRHQPANMFAKVHMDGCLIGRKINLRAHGSYDSLSKALTKMTRNFFCRKCTALHFVIFL